MATQTICIAPLLYTTSTLLSSMHIHFNNSTYMYKIPQLTGAPHIDSIPVPPLCIYSLAIVILLLLFNYSVTFISYLHFFKLHCWLGARK